MKEVRILQLPNIQIRQDVSKFVRSIDDGDEILYFKDQEYFFDDACYSKFIKEVEKMVRTSKDYSHFVGYIKNTLGMNFLIYKKDMTIFRNSHIFFFLFFRIN